MIKSEIFQGSPAGDLFYFLISSVREEIKVEKFDEFIQFYHERLVDSLKKLNYNQHIPTLSELQIDLIEKRAMGKKKSKRTFRKSII